MGSVLFTALQAQIRRVLKQKKKRSSFLVLLVFFFVHFCLHFLLNPLMCRVSWRVICCSLRDSWQAAASGCLMAMVLKLIHLQGGHSSAPHFKLLFSLEISQSANKIVDIRQKENSLSVCLSVPGCLLTRYRRAVFVFERLDFRNFHDFSLQWIQQLRRHQRHFYLWLFGRLLTNFSILKKWTPLSVWRRCTASTGGGATQHNSHRRQFNPSKSALSDMCYANRERLRTHNPWLRRRVEAQFNLCAFFHCSKL